MNKKLTAICSLLIIAAFIVGGSAFPAMSQGPQPVSALVKVDLRTEDDLQRIEAREIAVYAHLTTEDEDYLIAGVTEDDLAFLASQGLTYRVLDEELIPGEYYLVYPRHADQLSLISRHGRLLYFDGLRALIQAPAAEAERLPALGLEIRWLPDSPICLSRNIGAIAYESLSEPDPLIKEMIAQVDAATVYQYDGDLSGENEVTIGGQPYTLYTRYSYSGEPVQKATQFVYEHFQNLGLEVEYHDYNWGGNNWRNVVATKPGLTDPDDIYIICAHVDSISNDPYNYAPGADDNASGVTAVMIAADILNQYDFDYTIRFVAFTGEEQGLRGSHEYAQDAWYDGDNILGVLNLDMIAYDSDADSIIELHAGTGTGSTAIASLFTDVVDTYDIDLVPQIITVGATDRSDHASFWDYGYDAILGIEDWQDFTPYYHTTNDQLSTLNIPYFTEFVKASVGTVASMAGLLDGTVTPTPTATPTATPTQLPTPTPRATVTPTPTPVVECYCCSPGDSVYRIDGSVFYGYQTDSASDSPLIRVTSPPAPLGWNQPDFEPDSSWQLGSEVWWDAWDAPNWTPLPGDCRPIGLEDEDGNPEARGGTTHLYRRSFRLSPPQPDMQVTQAVLEMWSDNKTEWWWQGASVSYDKEGYIGLVDLFPDHVEPYGGTYVLAIQNSNDHVSLDYDPQGTACNLCVTWTFSGGLSHRVYLPLILKR
jgi:hypothetical protein